MPNIYMSDKEYEALAFLVGVARNVSDGATDETYLRDFNEADKHFSSLEKKFFKASNKTTSQKGK